MRQRPTRQRASGVKQWLCPGCGAANLDLPAQTALPLCGGCERHYEWGMVRLTNAERCVDRNPRYAVWWRTFDQWLRRRYFRVADLSRHRLHMERIRLADNPPPLSEQQWRRVRDITRTLGEGGAYRFAPAQERMHAELACDFIARRYGEAE